LALVSTPHDALFKRTFSDPEHVRDELRAVLSPAQLAQLNLATLRPCPGSFIDQALAGSHSDLLFSVELSGQPALVYVVCEHQSTVDPLMPLRMLGYVVRILLQHAEQAKGALPLPVVVPLLVHHSATGWTASTRLEGLFDPALLEVEGVGAWVPRFEILLDDLSHLSDEALWARTMSLVPRLTLWALRDGRDSKRLVASLARWSHLLAALAKAPSERDALVALFRYLVAVSDLPAETLVQAIERAAPEAEELMATVAEQWLAQGEARGLAKGEARGLAKGEAKGKAEGKAEGQARAVLAFLEARGLAVTAAQRARILGCTDLEQLDRWVRQAATAKTTAALFAAPKRPAKARR
jgi:predicted transposase/invertase (TIGR01784 family)